MGEIFVRCPKEQFAIGNTKACFLSTQSSVFPISVGDIGALKVRQGEMRCYQGHGDGRECKQLRIRILNKS